MARIDREITVSAPLENVFSYISDPGNWPEFWPSLIEIKEIESLPNGGYRASYEYKMAGMRFEGIGEHSRFAPNSWLVIETRGGIRSIITWTFRSRQPDETRLTLTVEYSIPIPLLGKLAEAVVLKMNEQEADLVLANLKTRFISN